MRRTKLILLLAIRLSAGNFALLSAQTLEVSPHRVLIDESAVIRATGLRANERITLRAETIDGAMQLWAAEAEFVADSQGNVDVSRQAPVKGSYHEVSAMGLVWSMAPLTNDTPDYESPGRLRPHRIRFILLRDGRAAATAHLQQVMVGDGVRRIRLEGKLHGVLFLPGADGPYPGVLVVGGSEGGAPIQKAAWLASRGFAALALAYFRYEDLPPDLEAIPLEYFESALGWMMERREIKPDKIAVVGTSRGGELALQLGSMFPQIAAVVAYVPANVRYPACCGSNKVPYAWTWKGNPLAFTRSGFRSETDTPDMIRVERLNGPLLLVVGEADEVWQSARMADAIVNRLRHAKFPFNVQLLKYSDAGHRAGRPEIVPAWHSITAHPITGTAMTLGGTPRGDAESSIDAIPKVLAFLKDALSADTHNDPR